MELLHSVIKYCFLGAAILSSVACFGTLFFFSEKEGGKGFWTRRVELTLDDLIFILIPVLFFEAFKHL